VGGHQFSPTCNFEKPFHEGMGSHILFYFFTLEFPNFLFSNIVFWNVADPLELVDYFGQ